LLENRSISFHNYRYIFTKTTYYDDSVSNFFPFLSFLFRGKILTAIICLILQVTLIGWIPAAIWAVISLQNARADKRTERLIKAMK
jgi:uncharacterized membrane protein YqaE (UPF0057 family)